jgi:hypothetical protein
VERYAGKYEGQQYVGVDLHRRRSVVVRTTDDGQLLEAEQRLKGRNNSANA